MTTIRELPPATNLKYTRVTSPTGQEWTIAHAWRIGDVMEPMDDTRLGLMLFPGDETTGEVKTFFITYGQLMDNWTVRE